MVEQKQALGGLLCGVLIGGVAVYLWDHMNKGRRWHHRPWRHHRMFPRHDPNMVQLYPSPDVELSLGDSGSRKTHYIPDLQGEVAMANVARANVGMLPGDRLPFNDYLDDRWITSEVWDRRTSVYRNDGVLYNTIGSHFSPNPHTDFHPEHRIDVAGAYTPSQEDGPRPQQQHAGGHFPECLRTGSNTNC